jgi:sulfur-oxidizing protein SoxB
MTSITKLIVTIIAVTLTVWSVFAQKNQSTTITILQTADIHAYLNPHQELFVEEGKIVFRKAGGLAHIKTLVDDIKKQNPHGTLLVDGGDFIQGSGPSVLSQGAIFPPIIKAMQYDLLIPGNWEVIYGKQVMMQLMQAYQTNVIVSNMYHQNNNEPLFPPYWITEKQGVKIGFIAYNDPEIPIRQNPGFSEGIAFTEVRHNLKSLIHQLKNKEQVDVLFLVAHIGISKQIVLANDPAVEGVDFILGNDTHERIRKPIEGKYAKVVEPGAFGSFLGRLDITVTNGKINTYNYELIEVNPNTHKANAAVQSIINTQQAPYNQEMNAVLGYTNTPLYRYLVVENPMDNMITDALLWKSGADFATSNGFRFGVPIVPDSSGKMAITQGDLWRMLPVNEHMKIAEVTGLQIKNWLEKEINNVYAKDPSKRFGGWLVRFAGMTLTFDSSKEMGEQVIEITIGGKPLQLDKVYKMASCNRTGEPITTMCRMPNATNAKIMDYTLHDAVKEYLRIKGTVSPTLDGRAKAVDLGDQAFSQLKEAGYLFR